MLNDETVLNEEGDFTRIKPGVPGSVLRELRRMAVQDRVSVNYHTAGALIKTYSSELSEHGLPAGAEEEWSARLEERAAAQRAAVDALQDALDERWMSVRDLQAAFGLDSYQFIALAHVLAGVADLDEEQALPAALRFILSVAKKQS